MSSTAKRHHFVPRVLLRRFSPEPAAKNPALFALDKTSGRPFQTRVDSEAVIGHYYRFNEASIPVSPDQAEQTLSRIESEAAEPIRKLVEGEPLNEVQRQSMAFFLHLQRQRTPGARAAQAFMDETMHIEVLKANLSSPEAIRRRFKDEGDPRSEDEVERWRVETLAQLEGGKIGVTSGQNREIALMFLAADRIVPAISYGLMWRSLRAPAGSGFICSDNPLNIYDPQAPTREPMHQGVGWVSSPAVEATLPLDPRICLLLTPGVGEWRMEDVDARRVAEINLRTYAAAQQFIYGPSQNSVQEVRISAKRNRALVAEFRPRPGQITILESVKGEPKPRKVTTHRPPQESFTYRRKS